MRLLVLASLVGSSSVARAEPPPQAIAFDAALGLSTGLPELQAGRSASATLGRLSLPRPWSALAILVNPSLRWLPVMDRGAEGTIAIQQAIPLADLTSARRTTLEADARARAADVAARTLEARLDVAAAWIAGWAARELLATAQRDRALARSILEVTERGSALGALTGPEVADARAFAAEAEVRTLDAGGRLADARFELGRALGRSHPVATAGALPAPALPDLAHAVLVARARSAPAATARRLVARAARARAAEERASRGTQLVLGGSLGRDGPGALVGIVTVGLSLPHDRGEREARSAELEASIADAEAATLAERAAIELGRALHDVEHAAGVQRELETRLVPAADDAAVRRQRGFDLGETTIVELLAARRTALAAHARLTEARATHAWARVRTWLLLEASWERP